MRGNIITFPAVTDDALFRDSFILVATPPTLSTAIAIYSIVYTIIVILTLLCFCACFFLNVWLLKLLLICYTIESSPIIKATLSTIQALFLPCSMSSWVS
jgi:hypothetical protein